ncbi:MAG: Hpt domain-containing protein [Treponema sp.]|nr:Hpt domain-containing protein [Treponema sp.]
MAAAYRVLIIDENVEELRSLTDMLVLHNMEVSSSKAEHAALRFLQTNIPDAIVIKGCDAHFKLLETLVADERFVAVPLLYILESDAVGSGAVALEAGAFDVFTLPLHDAVFSNRIIHSIEYVRCHHRCIKESQTPFSIDISKIEGIDYHAGVRNCAGLDTFKEALAEFYRRLDENYTKIQKTLEQSDWKNFRIYVHSLKSSARLIGALGLSDLAMRLEHAADTEDVSVIHELTPELLSLYKSYQEKLLPFYTEQTTGGVAHNQDKPLIDDDMLQSALADLKECVGIADFDSADFIMRSLSEYQIPADKKDYVEKIKAAVSDVNKEEIIKLLEKGEWST